MEGPAEGPRIASSTQHRSPRRYSAPRTNWIQSRGKPISHECLREHSFFKDRDPKLLDLLLETISVEVFLPGADILKEGDDGDCMYFMYRGEVEVLVGPEKKQVAKLKDGTLFGEMALLGNGKRTATIRAVKVCDCRVINAAAFQTALKRFPMEKFYFHQLAKERLAELNKTKGKDGKVVTLNALPSSPAMQKFRKVTQAVVAGVKMSKNISAPTSRSTTYTQDLVLEDKSPSPRSPTSPCLLASDIARRRSLQISLDTALDNFIRTPEVSREPTLDGSTPRYVPPSSAPAGTSKRPCSRRRLKDAQMDSPRYASNGSCSPDATSKQTRNCRPNRAKYMSNSSCPSNHAKFATNSSCSSNHDKYASNSSCSSSENGFKQALQADDPIDTSMFASIAGCSSDLISDAGWRHAGQSDTNNMLPTVRLGSSSRTGTQQTLREKFLELWKEQAQST